MRWNQTQPPPRAEAKHTEQVDCSIPLSMLHSRIASMASGKCLPQLVQVRDKLRMEWHVRGSSALQLKATGRVYFSGIYTPYSPLTTYFSRNPYT